MRRPKTKLKVAELEAGAADSTAHVVGEIAKIDEAGCASVFYPGNELVPVPARSIVDAPARVGAHPDALVGAPVLLVFENADPSRPIILGFLNAALRPEPALPEVRLDLDDARDVVVDGERIVFEAEQEILLRCGKSTLLMRKDGKVLVRGSELVSRASGANRVKGASIKLN